MNLKTPEIIESYLKGELSGADKAAFEAQLEQDPLFKSEIDLQKDIIQSLKAYRKNQLKERLNNIDVSGPSLINLTAIKFATYAIIIGMITYGSYYFITERNLNNESLPDAGLKHEQIVETPSIKKAPSTENIIEIPQSSTQEIAEKVETPKTIKKSSPKKQTRLEVVSPNVIDSFQDKQILAKESEFDHTISNNSLPTDKITEVEIKHEDTKGTELKYKYLNKKLYLYGDFSASPYELIELNSVVGKKLFLLHNSLYYQLSEDQKTVAPLNPIRDSLVIQELDSLKAHK